VRKNNEGKMSLLLVHGNRKGGEGGELQREEYGKFLGFKGGGSMVGVKGVGRRLR